MRFLGYQKAHSIQKYGTFCYLCHLPNYLNYNIHFKVHEKMCQIGQIWHISLKFKLLWLKNQIFYGLCKPKAIILLKIVITLENWWFDKKKLGKISLCKHLASSIEPCSLYLHKETQGQHLCQIVALQVSKELPHKNFGH